MAIGWLATLTSGEGFEAGGSPRVLSSSSFNVNNNNNGVMDSLSVSTTTAKMAASRHHRRHYRHRKIQDIRGLNNGDDNEIRYGHSDTYQRNIHRDVGFDRDDFRTNGLAPNVEYVKNRNMKYDDVVDAVDGEDKRGLYDTLRRGSSENDDDIKGHSQPWWYSERKHVLTAHSSQAKLHSSASHNRIENDKGYNYLNKEKIPISGSSADFGGDVIESRNRIGGFYEKNIDSGYRTMVKRTAVTSTSKKQYDSLPFNTNENSNEAHFDVEFFPESIENDSSFTQNQNDTTPGADRGNSGSGGDVGAKEYFADAAAANDPFSSVPWGSSPTNNAPNVAEFQKKIYNHKTAYRYGDDFFEKDKNINTYPILNNNVSHNYDSQSEERNTFPEISSFFQDGNFTASFSQDPVQNYHLDFNSNDFFSQSNISTAATATSPSSILDNMDMFTGSGSDLIFSFNDTLSGGNSNLNSNGTESDSSSSADIYIWLVLLMAPLVLFGIAGNTLVILAISLERRLQNITNYFLLSLAVTDLLVSLIVMPFSIINMITGRWLFGLLLCDFFVTSDVLMCTSSIFHLCFISAERYIGIRYPLWSKNKSKRVVLLKIVLVWTLAFAVTSPISILGVIQESNILVDGRCVLSNEHFVIYGSIFAFFIPLSIMVIMYILTVRMLSKQAKLCHKRRGEDGEVEPMIRRSTSSKRWQGRNKFYGGGGEFQTSFRNHDLKEHILDSSGNYHQQQNMYDTGGGCSGGGLRANSSNTLPHYKSATSPNNSLLRRGVVSLHRQDGSIGGRGNSVLFSSSGSNSPIINRNGMSTLNKNRLSSSHQDTIVLTKNSKNGKQSHSGSNLITRRSRTGGFFSDVINKSGDVDGKNNKHSKKNTSEYQFCNGHRSDSSEESSKDDKSGNRSSSPNDNNNKLKDLVRKHHVALKAANILLMRRVDNSHSHGHNSHHMTTSAMSRASTTTPPSSTKVSIRRDNSVKTEQKASKVLGVVFIIFVICWAPFFTVNILQVLCSSCNLSSTLFTAFVWLGYVSSTLNPIIYTIFNNIFRNTFIKLLCCRYRLLHRARRNSNLMRKENGMLASSTCSATFNTASTILSSTGNNCSIITTPGGGNGCNIALRSKATTSLNVMDESKC